MNNEVGMWIDHKRAVIVMVSGETEEILQVTSHVEKHLQFAGGAPEIPGEDQRDKRFLGHLSKYYDEVVSRVRDAESILIMGPGEAKGEFVKRLQREHLGGRIVGVEPADKMTDRQIAAKVRQHFVAKTL